jgi:hypothetical protein
MAQNHGNRLKEGELISNQPIRFGCWKRSSRTLRRQALEAKGRLDAPLKRVSASL